VPKTTFRREINYESLEREIGSSGLKSHSEKKKKPIAFRCEKFSNRSIRSNVGAVPNPRRCIPVMADAKWSIKKKKKNKTSSKARIGVVIVRGPQRALPYHPTYKGPALWFALQRFDFSSPIQWRASSPTIPIARFKRTFSPLHGIPSTTSCPKRLPRFRQSRPERCG